MNKKIRKNVITFSLVSFADMNSSAPQSYAYEFNKAKERIVEAHEKGCRDLSEGKKCKDNTCPCPIKGNNHTCCAYCDNLFNCPGEGEGHPCFIVAAFAFEDFAVYHDANSDKYTEMLKEKIFEEAFPEHIPFPND